MGPMSDEIEKAIGEATGSIITGNRAKAIGIIVGALTLVQTGSTILAGAAAGTAELIAMTVVDSATSRFLSAGKDWDDQKERATQVAEHVRRLLVPLINAQHAEL